MGAETVFTADGITLAQVTSFKYLEQIIMAADEDWTALVRNLRKARRKWERLMRVMSRERADARTLVHIYLAVVQLVLLYRSETWVMTPCIRMVLGRFHHRVSHRLTRRQPQSSQPRA